MLREAAGQALARITHFHLLEPNAEDRACGPDQGDVRETQGVFMEAT
jgi:hypothetical protein